MNVIIADVNENPKLDMVDYYVVTAQDVDTSSAGAMEFKVVETTGGTGVIFGEQSWCPSCEESAEL